MQIQFIIPSLALLCSLVSSAVIPTEKLEVSPKELSTFKARADATCESDTCAAAWTVPYIYNIHQFMLDFHSRAYRLVPGRPTEPFYKERFAGFKASCYKDNTCNTQCFGSNLAPACLLGYTTFTTSCKADADCKLKCGF
ncbi:hypothetical protein AYI70_g6710 [Smittium culicis]|uniref:Uncharacterized protein n=2 Tax=Smittium culicis TaxID=133412 RepID=A0A1R1XNS4_9FUNG|nr:hypothetical protein AYI70_g6710 [Smittium culicis]